MSAEYLRGKARTPRLLDDEDAPLLVMLRDLFIEHDAPFCIKELAAELGVSVFSVYKQFDASRPLRAETLLHIVRFIGRKDSRLVDLICGEGGYMPMPSDILEDSKSLRALLIHAEEILKKEK